MKKDQDTQDTTRELSAFIAIFFSVILCMIVFTFVQDPGTFTYIFTGIAVLIIFLACLPTTQAKQLPNHVELSFFKENDLKIEEGYFINNYVCGHVDIDNPCFNVSIYPKGDEFLIIANRVDMFPREIALATKVLKRETPKIMGRIPIKSITDIAIENRSTIENKYTVTRVLFLGVLALAFPKKINHNEMFICIDWEINGFKHNTIFQLGISDEANAVRNKLIRYITDNK